MPYALQVKNGASEDRLEKLIEARLQPGADKARIDERIWNLFGEEWAVMFTDLAGFSRRVAEFGIIHFLQVVYESERMLVPVIDRHDGILLKTLGDSLMVVFRNPLGALRCAIEMRSVLQTYNATRDDVEKVLLCVGLGYGKMLKIGDQDVFGAEVNAASKLGEDIATAWEILVTEGFRSACRELPEVGFHKIEQVPPGAAAAYRVIHPLAGQG
jgi:adenylate cyclase